MNKNKLLLNPGPTNTIKEVKDAQTTWSDVCHRTDEFLYLLNVTKRKLLERFDSQASFDDWNVTIMGGSGTINPYTGLRESGFFDDAWGWVEKQAQSVYDAVIPSGRPGLSMWERVPVLFNTIGDLRDP